MEPRLVQARAAVAEAEQRLEEFVSDRVRARSTRHGVAQRRESTLCTQTQEYDRVESLVAKKLVSASELDRAGRARPGARQPRSGSRRAPLLREGTRSEQLAQAAPPSISSAPPRAARRGRALPCGHRGRSHRGAAVQQGERPPTGAPLVVMLRTAFRTRVYVPEPLAPRSVCRGHGDNRWSLRIAHGRVAFRPRRSSRRTIR
jgi:hypothetical protein